MIFWQILVQPLKQNGACRYDVGFQANGRWRCGWWLRYLSLHSFHCFKDLHTFTCIVFRPHRNNVLGLWFCKRKKHSRINQKFYCYQTNRLTKVFYGIETLFAIQDFLILLRIAYAPWYHVISNFDSLFLRWTPRSNDRIRISFHWKSK